MHCVWSVHQSVPYYHVTVVGPTVIHPQYYGVQTPWGIYPANLIQQPQGQQTPQGMQQQQTQMMPRQSNGRPLTPSQQNDGMGTPQTLQAQPLQAPSNYLFLSVMRVNEGVIYEFRC